MHCIIPHTMHFKKYLGCIRVGNLMRKAEQTGGGDRRQQLGRRLDACRRADIECSHTRCWWETTCFLWSTATYIVEVISFSSRLRRGRFTVKAPVAENLFNERLKAACPSLAQISVLKKYSYSLGKQFFFHFHFSPRWGRSITIHAALESLRISF